MNSSDDGLTQPHIKRPHSFQSITRRRPRRIVKGTVRRVERSGATLPRIQSSWQEKKAKSLQELVLLQADSRTNQFQIVPTPEQLKVKM